MGKLLRFPRRRRRARPERGLFDQLEGERPSRAVGAAGDARPLLPPPSDALPAEAAPAGARGVPPEVERRARRRRRTALIVAASVFLSGLAASIVADRGYLDVRRSQRVLEEMEKAYAVDQERFLGLKQEVQDLRADPRKLERIARERLLYAKPGEVVVVLPPEPEPSLDAARRSAIVAPASEDLTRGGAVR